MKYTNIRAFTSRGRVYIHKISETRERTSSSWSPMDDDDRITMRITTLFVVQGVKITNLVVEKNEGSIIDGVQWNFTLIKSFIYGSIGS